MPRRDYIAETWLHYQNVAALLHCRDVAAPSGCQDVVAPLKHRNMAAQLKLIYFTFVLLDPGHDIIPSLSDIFQMEPVC
jgi:hypothetical protein